MLISSIKSVTSLKSQYFVSSVVEWIMLNNATSQFTLDIGWGALKKEKKKEPVNQ